MKNVSEKDGPRGTLILGIDPGTAATGYGLIQIEGNRLRSLDYGTWRPQRDLKPASKLAFLAAKISDYLEDQKPQLVSIEQAFLGKNVQSTLRLGEARGALMAACATLRYPVHEYPTATVKKAVIGNGRASKEQVRYMTTKLLSLKETPKSEDACDALAVAITLAFEVRFNARAAR